MTEKKKQFGWLKNYTEKQKKEWLKRLKADRKTIEKTCSEKYFSGLQSFEDAIYGILKDPKLTKRIMKMNVGEFSVATIKDLDEIEIKILLSNDKCTKKKADQYAEREKFLADLLGNLDLKMPRA